jgi:hypothetical protein
VTARSLWNSCVMTAGTPMTQRSREEARSRTLLLVAGSGRSGTSLFAGLSNRLGMHIPQPEVVANDSNPRGFGEPRWAVDFHEELLRSVAVTPEDARPGAFAITQRVAARDRARRRLEAWLEEQFQASDRVVVKDPRLTWFLDLYSRVSESMGVDIGVVTMLRHPAASIKSRQLAYGTRSTDVRRLAGWLNMMLFLEKRTRDLPRAVVAYDDLLDDWRRSLAEAERALRVPLLQGATAEQLAGAAELVDPTLRRAAPDWSLLDVPSELQDLGEAAFKALSGVAVGAGTTASGAEAALDEVREAYVRYHRTAESVAGSTIAAARAKERRKVEQELSTQRPTETSARIRRVLAAAGHRVGRLTDARHRR